MFKPTACPGEKKQKSAEHQQKINHHISGAYDRVEIQPEGPDFKNRIQPGLLPDMIPYDDHDAQNPQKIRAGQKTAIRFVWSQQAMKQAIQRGNLLSGDLAGRFLFTKKHYRTFREKRLV